MGLGAELSHQLDELFEMVIILDIILPEEKDSIRGYPSPRRIALGPPARRRRDRLLAPARGEGRRRRRRHPNPEHLRRIAALETEVFPLSSHAPSAVPPSSSST